MLSEPIMTTSPQPTVLKIMVIDDSSTIRRSAEIFLTQAGYQVVLAEDQAVLDALSACDQRYYDNDEAIADRLFAWIKENRALVRVGA